MTLYDKDLPSDPERRVQTFIRQWPAKQVARDTGADLRTVNGWRQGNRPNAKALFGMVATWGRPFLDFVFPDPSAEELEQEALVLARAQVELAQQRRERARHAASRRVGAVERMALAGLYRDPSRMAGFGGAMPVEIRGMAFQGAEG